MSKNNQVLIVDKMHESIISLLTELGFNPEYKPELTREEILSQISDFMGLIIRSKTTVDQELVIAGSQLRFVARAGAGLDKLDSECLKRKRDTHFKRS